MPGANCSVFGCTTSRRKKYKGVSIFKLPSSSKSPSNKKWRNEILNIITKDRVIDDNFKKQIESGNIFICEKHFSCDQLLIYQHKKELREDAIPTLNLPQKSIPSTITATERSTVTIEKREYATSCSTITASATSHRCYKHFRDFQYRINNLRLNDWDIITNIDKSDDNSLVVVFQGEYLIPKYQIFVDSSLGFTLRVFGWLIPLDHIIYTRYRRSFFNVTLSNFILFLNSLVLCIGITMLEKNLSVSSAIRHIIPKKFSYDEHTHLEDSPYPVHQMEYLRSKSCIILIEIGSHDTCKPCLDCQANFNYCNKQKEKVNLTQTSPQRIKLALQDLRLECHQLKEEVAIMKDQLENNSQSVDADLGNDFVSLFSKCDIDKIPPFMKLFWSEQQKYLKNLSSLSSIRYHPMIIKFCLNLAAKSASSYSDIRYNAKDGTGVLVLPSLRTLRDYKNHIRPQRGFNPEIVADLKKKIEGFSPAEKFVGIQFDEMKIQEDLVWDKHTGDLIGFVDLGDDNVNFATLKDQKCLASHVLVFLIRSIVNPLSYSLATFATTGATSFQIFIPFWRSVAILEDIGLKVISCTADGASPNRKFFKMPKVLFNHAEDHFKEEPVYFTLNVYAKGAKRNIFFSDAPHLLKTARNCMANFGSNINSRLLWNAGFYILWSHISDI